VASGAYWIMGPLVCVSCVSVAAWPGEKWAWYITYVEVASPQLSILISMPHAKSRAVAYQERDTLLSFLTPI
jgi:hypothetical protein